MNDNENQGNEMNYQFLIDKLAELVLKYHQKDSNIKTELQT